MEIIANVIYNGKDRTGLKRGNIYRSFEQSDSHYFLELGSKEKTIVLKADCTLIDEEDLQELKPETPEHYDNTNGSLYKFAEDHKLNSYEFDIIKRVIRCRKKGEFLNDLNKTKNVIDIYIKEQTKI